MKMKKSRIVWHVLAFIVVFSAIVAVVMLLWNALIPSIIGWSAINYWQAAGLMILCKFLFGGLGGHHKHHFWKRKHKHSHLHERMAGMTNDEKREFIRKRMAMGFRGFDDICENRKASTDRNEE